ncbi:TMEM175 family protein [uncultured Sphingomonas sp.]|uniref:TMEM175 family protein n=1 Tax=uncultured Sphingomonas sp. TaxID=158754 RepID=UPI0035CAA1CE
MNGPISASVASTHHSPAHALERLVFFSDAVFAISITLLVIELHVPVLPRNAPDLDYAITLFNLTPHFIGFFASFFVIGAFWGGHHRAFDCARHWSPRLMRPNLFLLCTVAAMPFFTAFMSDYYGKRVPTIAYCVWLLLVAICNLWNNSMAVSPGIAADDLDPEHAALMKRRGWAVILGTLTALAVAAVNPWIALFALTSMPLWRLVLERLHRRRVNRTIR